MIDQGYGREVPPIFTPGSKPKNGIVIEVPFFWLFIPFLALTGSENWGYPYRSLNQRYTPF